MVNNAGICTEAASPAPVDESSEEQFDRHLQINTKGAYLGCKYAVEQMKKQEPHACGVRGWIVNVASLGATVGIPGLGRFNLERFGGATVANIETVCYNASKGAIVSLTKTVAVDVGQFGITCNAICPGCKYPFSSQSEPPHAAITRREKSPLATEKADGDTQLATAQCWTKPLKAPSAPLATMPLQPCTR